MLCFTFEQSSPVGQRIFVGTPGELAPHDEHPGRLQPVLDALTGRADVRLTHSEPGDRELSSVHDPGMLRFLRDMADANSPPVFPDSFPPARGRAPESLRGRFGYFCTDAQTPFHKEYWADAVRAAGCALTAADSVSGSEPVYVACRPPGHHAGRAFFGGYCYLNNVALAAAHLARSSRGAILDIDYHHGNGTQDCFYETDAVFTVSIHADTRHAYPFFSGHQDERGEEAGTGWNLNLPVSLDVSADEWFATLDRALTAVLHAAPEWLAVSFGTDTFTGDPVGGLSLEVDDYREVGRRIASAGLPLLIMHEGGYATGATESIVAGFVEGLRG